MKIALAQINPVKGAIATNISLHKKWIQSAIQKKATVIIFPELSITGYEPTLAEALATTPFDSRFNIFQQLSNQYQLMIGIGVPLKNSTGINISLLLFHPNQPRQIYAKKYLHPDELPFFENGQNDNLIIKNTTIGLAICYELSIPNHITDAHKKGAKLYLASVAKNQKGVQQAAGRLSSIAKNYSMPTLMVNCVGCCDDFEAIGQSAVWGAHGKLLGQLPANEEGLLIFNMDTEEVYSISKLG